MVNWNCYLLSILLKALCVAGFLKIRRNPTSLLSPASPESKRTRDAEEEKRAESYPYTGLCSRREPPARRGRGFGLGFKSPAGGSDASMRMAVACAITQNSEAVTMAVE